MSEVEIFLDKVEIQHSIRKQAIKKLQSAILYPGMNSILVIGDTGTGKTHWINEIISSAPNNTYCKAGSNFYYGGLCESTKNFWKQVMISSNNKVLIIEEVEKLTMVSQDLLFDALSTVNGAYGFEDKSYRFILIFSSNFSMSKLRDDRRYLSAKFFDRISQFVIEFPNFDKTQTKIYADFKSTWEKMKFDSQCPSGETLNNWLETEAYRMHGNFRDLDKIVVNWNLHRMNGHSDDEILNIIKEDYKSYLHNPLQSIYEDNCFVFDESLSYGDVMDNFRSKLKSWSVALNNGNLRAAAKMLKISHRTIERW